MRATSAAQHCSVVSLLNEGYSHCQIQARTSLGKGTVDRIAKEVKNYKENNAAGHPSKLSTRGKTAIIQEIFSRRVDNAVQATNSQIPLFISLLLLRQLEILSSRVVFTLQQRRKSLC